MTTSVDAVPEIHGGAGQARAATLAAACTVALRVDTEVRKLDRRVFGDASRGKSANDPASGCGIVAETTKGLAEETANPLVSSVVARPDSAFHFESASSPCSHAHRPESPAARRRRKM